MLLLDTPTAEIDWSQLYNKTEKLMSIYKVDLQSCGNVIPTEQVVCYYLEHEALAALADENARAILSMTLDLFVGVGDVKNIIELAVQRDLITGQKLTAMDYALMFAPAAIVRHTPSGVRKIIDHLPGSKCADDIAEAAESAVKHADDMKGASENVEGE